MKVRTRTRKLVSIFCVLALMVGLVPLSVAAATPLLEETEAAETPAEDAATLYTVTAAHNFTDDGTSSSVFTISGTTATNKGTVTYNGLTLTTCLKMESKTSISFTATAGDQLTLVFLAASGKKVTVDGTARDIPSDGILTIDDLTATTHSITKGNGGTTDTFLYYMSLGSTHIHQWDEGTVTTEPTCTEPGVMTYTCSDPDCPSPTKTEPVDALGHDWKTVEAKAASCTQPGWNEYQKCSRCDAVQGYVELPANGEHQFSGGACSVCGMAEHTNHTWDEGTVTKAATCTEPGVTTFHCTVDKCDGTKTEEIAALGHSMTIDHAAQAATCTEDGWNAYQECSRCGYTNKTTVKATGHTDANGDNVCDVCRQTIGTALTGAGGWFETLYVDTDQFTPGQVTAVRWTGAMSGSLQSGDTAGFDMDFLVRSNGSGGTRIDIPGLTAGKYTLTVTAGGASYQAENLEVMAYDRSGFAHFNYTDGVGAYRDDGILKENAIVLYVTNENKDTVAVTSFDGTTVTGIGNILNTAGMDIGSGTTNNGGIPNSNQGILKKLAQDGTPLVVRLVGNVTKPEGTTAFSSVDYGGTKGDNGAMARMKDARNVTIEGVGPDACADGWGFHFMAGSGFSEGGKSFEVRNIAFRNVPEDCIGMEGVQEGGVLTASVERCWIHNCEFYVPKVLNPAESDKAEGDGACDFKRGQYMTMSYCYFVGYHKTNLVGASDSNLQFHITWHHNYWKDCESRGPLGRQANMHIYNNIYEGNSSYAMNTRANCYIFSEYNTFINCKNPMQVVAKSSGGPIKSYEDVLSGCSGDQQGTIVNSRSTPVDSDNVYAKFELSSDLSYIPSGNYKLDQSTSAAKANIMAYAGTMKAATEVIKPEEVDTSILAEDRVPTASVALPYDKALNNTLVTSAKSKVVVDNIVFYVGKVAGDCLTIGGSSAGGQNIVFKVDEPVDITITEVSDGYRPALLNEEGKTLVAGSGTATSCPAGTYFIQTETFEGGGYKESKISHLSIQRAASGAPHTHSYTGWTQTVAPTCTREGVEMGTCSCGETSTRSIAMIAHNYVNGACSMCGLIEGTLGGDDSGTGGETVSVTGLTLDTTAVSLYQGGTQRVVATVSPSNASKKTVTWSTSDANVATVATNGTITAKGPGKATVTATTADGGFTQTVAVTVIAVTTSDYTFVASDQGDQPADQTPAADGQTLGTEGFFTVSGAPVWRTKNKESNKATSSLQLGQQQSSGLRFTIPAGSTGKKVTLSFSSTGTSNHSAIGILDGDGNLVATSSGTRLGWVMGTSAISVTYESLAAGTYTIVAPSGVEPEEVGMEAFAGGESDSTDPNARGVRLFSASVTVQTVTGDTQLVAVTGVTLNKTTASMTVGDTLTLTPTVSPANASNKSVFWTSSNTAVATVSAGTVVAKAAGTATITVKTVDGEKPATCTVTVTAANVPKVTALTINGADAVAVGESITLSVSAEPEEADSAVSWSTGNAAVATVNSVGKVTGLVDGEVTITATAKDGSGVTAIKVITVGAGNPKGTLDGAARDLTWVYSGGKLTVAGMQGDDLVLAACYNDQGLFTGVKCLTPAKTEAAIPADTPAVRLFWLGAQVAPMCPDVFAWGSLGN